MYIGGRTALKSVVRKQHTVTTFHGNALKLKKAADAGLFCFTIATARSKLGRVQENWLQSPLGLGGRPDRADRAEC